LPEAITSTEQGIIRGVREVVVKVIRARKIIRCPKKIKECPK
jgi:hypothetical protein